MTTNPKDNSFLVTLKLDGLTTTSHHMHLSKTETDRLERMWAFPNLAGLNSSDVMKIVDVKSDVHEFKVGQIIGLVKRAFDPDRAKRRTA